jgi:hypothetical protein
MGTLWTIGTGPPASIGSSLLLLELLDSLLESSESLLLDELELELRPECLVAVITDNPLPLGRAAAVITFVGGFGGTGIDASMAAVEDIEVKVLRCRGLVGGA